MNGDDQKLLKYNERGALSHVLALEEHLQQLPYGADRSWCARKHALLALDHHLAEAVNHASRFDANKASRIRSVRAEAEEVLRPAADGRLPDLGRVAGLRNRIRAAFGDRTLEKQGQCSVCAADQGMGALVPAGTPWYRSPIAWAGIAGLFWLWRQR